MKRTTTNHWLKEAVIYSLDIRSFKDGNQDGFGDLKGLIAKFDYLIELGVTCLWILPFFSSDNQDGGYDIVNYYEIDPALGDMHDFDLLIKKAKENGLRIIIDLVVNHTSKEHPWFQQAIRHPSSRYHQYYIWMAQKPKEDAKDVVFKEVEDSNWAYEPDIDKYYYHTFYSHQPDLNVANPLVQEEILKIIKFWLQKGVSGFRIDAAPHILHEKGEERFSGDPYNILNQWRQEVLKWDKEGILIGEADVEPEDYAEFLDRGRRLTAIFNFFINNYLFLAFAERNPQALIQAFSRLSLSEDYDQYLNFLRNHDELDLERLQEAEREKVFAVFAPQPSMRIYGRGIRRRLASMVNGDSRRLKLSMSLLLSLPGIPIIRYGEEIGMGDDLGLPERESVRTSMQWSAEPSGGFSMATSEVRSPVIREGAYSYHYIHVAQQRRDPTSLWHEVARLISVRKQNPVLANGSFRILPAKPKQVMIYTYKQSQQTALVIHNFDEQAVEVFIDWPDIKAENMQILVGKPEDLIVDRHKLHVHLMAYGYSWFLFD